MQIVRYEESLSDLWDTFCLNAQNCTFIQTRNFLSYHKDRFCDESVIIFDNDKVLGIFPAARSLFNSNDIISHPGITYGGLIHNGGLSGVKCINIFIELIRFYKDRGFNRLIYKPVPYLYHRVPSQDDIYALFILGAVKHRADLSSAIDLFNRRPVSERRRRSLKKAAKKCEVVSGNEYLSDLWGVLNRNLSEKHDARPVHSFEEIIQLVNKFPNNIRVVCARINNLVEAGVVIFQSKMVWHCQYIASSSVGYDVSALDLVFDYLINEAVIAGVRYFDFGTSNEDEGKILNDGLYRFKTEFGGGGIVHEHYTLTL